MKRLSGRWLLALAILVSGVPAGAAFAQIEHTRTAIPGTERPRASVNELAWMAGEWRGPGIEGAPAVEAWSAPVGGSMTGHFVQTDAKGAVWFHELIQIAPDGESLRVRLKHFNADLTGWEEKDKTVDFPLIAREGDSWYFNGLTYRREGPDRLFFAVRMKHSDGKVDELMFRFERAAR